MNLTTTHKQAIVYKWKKIHATTLWIFRLTQKKQISILLDNQLNICRAFNLDVQYPHAIETSMTIHMQGGTKRPE